MPKIYLAFILLASVLWQPTHHMMMSQGISMNFGIHAFITMIPFLSFFLFLGKAKWGQQFVAK